LGRGILDELDVESGQVGDSGLEGVGLLVNEIDTAFGDIVNTRVVSTAEGFL